MRIAWIAIRVFFYMLWISRDLQKAKRYTHLGNLEARNKIVAKISKAWSQFVVDLTGSTVEVIGEEYLPPQGIPLVIVANHQSAFDIPLIMGYLKRPVTFISKKENLKLPFVGQWIKHSNCVLIDRGNPRSAVKTIAEGAKIIKQGHTQALFPEGTRSKDGCMRPFKAGGFKLAEKSGAAVLPVAIVDAYKLMPKGTLKITKQHIKLIVSPLVYLEGYSTKQISEKCYAIISENLKKHQGGSACL